MSEVLFSNEYARITKTVLNETVELLSIEHEHCSAQVSLYAGQVLSYKPSNTQELFWLSKDSLFEPGKAIRGGIPLCWPWFGENNKQTAQQKAGNHGFARQVTWQVSAISADETAVYLSLSFQGENQHSLWPHKCHLQQDFILGKDFKQSLIMTNLANEPVEYTGALHSYFYVSHPEHVVIERLDGVAFDDKLTGLKQSQASLPNCQGPIDRIYHSGNTMVLQDKVWQREIEIHSNTSQWVLWNPGTETASAMTDIHAGGEHEFVCLEAANTNWQQIEAGQTAVMQQHIKVHSLKR
ncbi:D-hexose-6-phosphate mutarotase [Litorilituus sediminis]|uniref:Putative glucose-6-phosphate 1-epimerase n=1 Tax=Litorilituus sediminis TaxID=718192 RepID=A0A4P6P6Y6_9GAMM|nr:D-hexose-6-phosphate mutarotase [Litorilituus sediminis]QBG37506.1 D-hexose-6-phosphate mutarotase [Litorilituus sediminis]